MNLRIYFDIPIYVILLLAIASAGLAYLMYRKIEGISRPRQVFLAVLRALSFFLLLLSVTNLVTDFVRFREEKHSVILLVDDSKSMSLSDGGTPRPRVVNNILESPLFGKLSSDFKVTPVAFGSSVLKISSLDSLKFNQPSTNIESALIDASNLGSDGDAAFAVLLSDGNYNTGGDPLDVARGLAFPVFTIGIGDSTRPSDVIVRQVIAAPSIYAGKKSVVRAIVRSTGFGGKSVTAYLMEDGKEIDSKEMTLPNEGDVEASFNYTPATVGTHVLTVYVPPQMGEFNRKNNSSSVTADVLKGKYSILLVAGEPSSDVAFLRRSAETSGDFDLNVLIQRDGDKFYTHNPPDQTDVNRILSQKYDAVVLYDFPNSQSRTTLSDISALLNSTRVPFAYFAGKDFSAEQVAKLPRLPFVPGGIQPGEFQIGISPLPSSSVGLQSLQTLLNANFSLFPPLYYQRIGCKPVFGAASLAVPVLNGVRLDSPVFLVDQVTRSAAFLAYGIWRLQLMSSLSGLSGDFLQNFFTTLLRTLIGSGKQKLLTVHTDKRVYDPSETVNFNALLVDQTGSPVDGATVDVNIKRETTSRSVADIRLAGESNGAYTGSLGGLGEGKYTYVAQARSTASFFGADSGTIVVEPLNTEFVQTAMNVQLLRQLASVTGGKFLTPHAFMTGGLQISPEWRKPVTLTDTKRFELLSLLPILGVVILLLSIEWIMRKIWGLP
ncbi:MAG: hypothetical protein M1378_05005 [Bacteroidetes bacterium]|nr:hypothetical protein [Bacteroidota bacterium]